MAQDFAIRTFGSNDKQVLLIGIGVVLAIAAVLIGIVAVRRPRVGWIGLAVLTGIGVWAVLTRPDSTPNDVLPVLLGAGAGAIALHYLLKAAHPGRSTEPASPDRRAFIVAAGVGAALAVVAGGAGTFLSRRFKADDSRAMVRLPPPSSLGPADEGDVRRHAGDLAVFHDERPLLPRRHGAVPARAHGRGVAAAHPRHGGQEITLTTRSSSLAR